MGIAQLSREQREIGEIPSEAIELQCRRIDRRSRSSLVRRADAGVLPCQPPQVALRWRNQCGVPIDEHHPLRRSDRIGAMGFTVGDDQALCAFRDAGGQLVVSRQLVANHSGATLEQAARALAAPLVHALFAVIWGFGCTQAMLGGLGRVERWAWQAGTLVLAMLAHGLYDFFLLAWSAPLVSSGLVLALWILLIWYAKRLLRAEKARRRATS